MELRLKTDRKDHIDKYLRVWNGLMGLTTKEFNVTKSILETYVDVKDGGVEEPYLSEIVFSNKKLKPIKEKYKLNHANWYSLKKSLLAKRVLYETEGLTINPRLIPQTEITFKFLIDGNNG